MSLRAAHLFLARRLLGLPHWSCLQAAGSGAPGGLRPGTAHLRFCACQLAVRFNEMKARLAAVIIWTQSVGTLGAKASIALMLCTFSCFTTGKAVPLQPAATP